MSIAGLSQRLGKRLVLQGIDATFRPGEFWVVVGPNGAGKSTLLRSAAGILRPETGRVTWQARSVHDMTPTARARQIAWVPQEMRIRDPFTVTEVVAMGRYAHTGSKRNDSGAHRRVVGEALAATDLLDLAPRAVTTLSSGERQRVLLARALAQDPACLLLDEPTSNLDLGQADAVLRLLVDRAHSGRSVVAVLHDLELASRVADGILLLADGRVAAAGPPEKVLTAKQLGEAFRTTLDVSWNADGARIRVQSNAPL